MKTIMKQLTNLKKNNKARGLFKRNYAPLNIVWIGNGSIFIWVCVCVSFSWLSIAVNTDSIWVHHLVYTYCCQNNTSWFWYRISYNIKQHEIIGCDVSVQMLRTTKWKYFYYFSALIKILWNIAITFRYLIWY